MVFADIECFMSLTTDSRTGTLGRGITAARSSVSAVPAHTSLPWCERHRHSRSPLDIVT